MKKSVVLLSGLTALIMLCMMTPSATATGADYTLDPPVNVTANAVENEIICLTWQRPLGDPNVTDEIENSYYYLIYRSASANGTYSKIGFTKKVTYYDANVTAGQTYYYKVQSYIKDSSGTEWSSNNLSVTPVSVQAKAFAIPTNEFTTQTQAQTYLKEQLLQRKNSIDFTLWINVDLNNSTQKAQMDQIYSTMPSKTWVDSDLATAGTGGYDGDFLRWDITGFTGNYTAPGISRNDQQRISFHYDVTYLTTAAQMEQAIDAADNIIADINANNPGADTAQLVRAVYDWLGKNTVYDKGLRAAVNQSLVGHCSAYDALVLRKSVCQGYSSASYLLLSRLGIANRMIFGHEEYNGEQRVHAWNIVLNGEKWYNLDCCWATEFYMECGFLDYTRWMKNSTDFSAYTRDSNSNTNAFFSAHPMATSSLPAPVVLPVSISLSQTRLTLGTGAARAVSVRFTPQNTTNQSVVWVSSDPSVVEVSSNSVRNVVGKKAGSATFTAYATDDHSVKAVCTVTVFDPQVPLVSATYTSNGVRLTWSESPGAEFYNVYRSTVSGSLGTYLGNSTSTAWTDSNITAGCQYFYTLRPYYRNAENKLFATTASAQEKVITLLQPVLQSAGNIGGGNRITWNQVPGARGYWVYRCDPSVGKYVRVASTSALNYTDTSLSAHSAYYYAVLAWSRQNGTVFVSDFSDTKALLPATAIQGVTVQNGKNKLEWAAIAGARGYNIYSVDSKTGSTTYLKSVLGRTNDTVTAVSGCTYIVRPYLKLDGRTYYATSSNAVSCLSVNAPVVTLATLSTGGVQVSWNAKSGSRYEIYRYNGSTYTYLKTVTGASYIDLTPGTGYVVRRYVSEGSTRYYSPYVNVFLQ